MAPSFAHPRAKLIDELLNGRIAKSCAAKLRILKDIPIESGLKRGTSVSHDTIDIYSAVKLDRIRSRENVRKSPSSPFAAG